MSNILSYAITHIIECFISYYFFSHKLVSQNKKSQVILTHASGYFILFIIAFFHNVLLNLIFFVVINLFIVKFSYRITLKSAIFYSFILAILMSSTELIAEFIPHAFFHTYNTPDLDNSTILLCFILSKVLYLVTVLFITKHHGNSYYIQTNIHLIIIILLSLMLIFALTYIGMYEHLDYIAENILVMSAGIILFIIIAIICLQEYIETKQLELFQTNYDLQQAYNYQKYFQLAKEQNDSQKLLIHDIKNHLHILSTLCKDGKASEACRYIEELTESDSIFKKTKFSNCDNLNLILALYQSKCNQLNITYNVDVQNADLSFIHASDLTSLFCNLLDNSIAAAQGIAYGYVSVIIRQQNMGAYTISVSNTCLQAPKTNERGELISSKPNPHNHGIGFHSITKVVEKYNGHMHYYYDEAELVFHNVILIYNTGNEV